MTRKLFYKLATAMALITILLLALARIEGLIHERQAVRNEVLVDIARSSSYEQKLTGPLLVVPYQRRITEWKETTDGKRYAQERSVSGHLYFTPELLTVDGQLQTELRSRGIYQARLYHANTRLGGRFVVPVNYGIDTDLPSYEFGSPFLTLGISDIRGIENALTLQWNDQRLSFEPGSALSTIIGSGVHAMLPLAASEQTQPGTFSIDLKLQGTGQLNITPVGRETRVQLSADWPHPSFSGEFLPVEHEITDQGFTARWQTSFFATNMAENLNACVTQDKCEAFNARHFGVTLVNPVDHYLKSERAIKYALLFIALTFAGFFLFEILKQLAVHPIQYGLVGLALALFYLLLISLSEHLGFALAYAASATACVALLTIYIGSVLSSMLRGLGFGSALAALYGLLYGLLSSEDYALLMGSLLVFALLSTAMLLTRKVNWFHVTGNSGAAVD